ncbi:MAG: hypothetical protein WDN28_05855 [Chthoniobacter sp.]
MPLCEFTANDFTVLASDIARIDGEIRHIPMRAPVAFPFAETLLIASWCEPEKAVKTSSPAYGWRGGTVMPVHRS